MINSIAEYLHELRHELAGSDPATILDALSDTEDHLNTAVAGAMAENRQLSDADALAGVITRYGTPTEIAAAYRDTESRTRPALAVPERYYERSAGSRFFGIVYDPRAWGALLYMVISMVTGIVYFTWVTTGLYLSIGLLVLIIGLPVAYLFLMSFRGIALVEGRIIEGLLGVRMPRRSLFSQRDLRWWQQLKVLVRDKRTWATVTYMVIQMPLGIIYFTVTIVLLVLSVVLVASPILRYVF
ncbi:MAG: sensor domain-containing protein, partial [candidate division Zixibacteria bacterium]|nr:sensor domain-containing protein [candidate division Zixibacteria bacterium]